MSDKNNFKPHSQFFIVFSLFFAPNYCSFMVRNVYKRGTNILQFIFFLKKISNKIVFQLYLNDKHFYQQQNKSKKRFNRSNLKKCCLYQIFLVGYCLKSNDIFIVFESVFLLKIHTQMLFKIHQFAISRKKRELEKALTMSTRY